MSFQRINMTKAFYDTHHLNPVRSEIIQTYSIRPVSHQSLINRSFKKNLSLNKNESNGSGYMHKIILINDLNHMRSELGH